MTHSLPARRSADPALFRGVSVVEPGAGFKFAALSIAAAAIFAGQPVFWTLPPRFLTGARAAAGFAAINSVGNLGGLIAQTTVPAIHDRTGSNLAPMLFLAVCLAATALGVLVIERRLPRGSQRSEEHTSELQSLMRNSYAVFCLT